MHHLYTLLLSVLAFASLALARPRHQEDLFDRELDARATAMLLGAGWLLLCGSIAVALSQPARAVGLVAWFGCVSAGAGLVLVGLVVVARFRRKGFN